MIQTTNRKHGKARGAELKGRSAGNPTHEEDEEGGSEGRHDKRQRGKSSARGGKGSPAGNVAVAGKRGNNAEKRRKTATGMFSRAAGSTSPYRTADGSGLVPSDEMRLLLEARESTRAAGEPGGSGRRPRVPSRKFLEASGRGSDEGAQWMTKEKREEQGRKNRELKEQRKAVAAAGLQVGQVVETADFPSPRGANTRPERSVSGGSLGCGDGAVSNVCWRKLTPAEILRVAGKHPAVDGAQFGLPVNNAEPADATGVVVAVSKGKQEEGRASVSAAAAAETNSRSETKQEYVAATGGPAAQQGSTVVDMAFKNRPKRSKKDHNEVQREGQKRDAKTTCEFERCPKKASFGVNGVVRYW